MERLIELDNNNKLVIQPEALAIPAYSALWNRDKSKDKKAAIQDLTYVWFTMSLDKYNPYRHYQGADRDKIIISEVMSKGWKADKEIFEAIKQFEKNNYTRATGFIKAAITTCDKLQNFYETVDLNERTISGGLVYKATDLQKSIGDISKTLEGLRALETQQLSEDTTDQKVKGGGKVGAFEG